MTSDVTIRRRLASGALWMIAMRMASRLLGLGSTIILARILTPEDFGLVALATMLLGALEMLGEFGFDLALIKDQKAQRHHYDTVWTLTIVRNIVIAALLCILALPVANFFEEPRLDNIIYYLAVGILIEGFANVGIVDFRKKLDFNKEFRFRFTINLLRVLITVVIAVIYPNYWALVAGIVVGRIFYTILSYKLHDYRPGFCLRGWQEVMSFSGWLLVISVCQYFQKQGYQFFIAKYTNSSTLGIYNVAYEISNLASSELIAPIKRASIPVFSKINDNIVLLRKTFLDVSASILLLSLPVAVGIGLTSELIIPVLLGEGWEEAIPLMKILAIFGLIESGRSQVRPVFIAMNKPRLGFYLVLFGLVTLFPMLVWSLPRYGSVGAAWSIVLSSGMMIVGEYFILNLLLKIKIRDIMSYAWRIVLAGMTMAFILVLIKKTFSTTDSVTIQLFQLLICFLAGGVSYMGSIVILWIVSGKPTGIESSLIGELVIVLRARRGSGGGRYQ